MLFRSNDTGYRGRIGINEILIVDDEIREAILKKASATSLRKLAIERGMTPMLQDGFMKAQEGTTTLDEVLRVIHE